MSSNYFQPIKHVIIPHQACEIIETIHTNTNETSHHNYLIPNSHNQNLELDALNKFKICDKKKLNSR